MNHSISLFDGMELLGAMICSIVHKLEVVHDSLHICSLHAVRSMDNNHYRPGVLLSPSAPGGRRLDVLSTPSRSHFGSESNLNQ